MASRNNSERPRLLTSVRAALGSRRIGAVALQSFSSGLPLGLIWIALPAYLTYGGVDIRMVGVFSLAQAPWTFKFLWAPLMDRYAPGFLDRKRSWMIVSQLFLLLGIGALAFQNKTLDVAMVAVLSIIIAFWSATQDIAIDAYAVEVLERSEQGLAVGARVALYRAATLIGGAVAITLGERIGWGTVFIGLALLFLPLAGVVLWSPALTETLRPPRTLSEAVVEPLVDIFRRSQALQIIAFLLLYKFGENLATALIRPFLIRKCFVPEDVGLATATIGLVAIIGGTFFGGWMTERIGLGRALWLFGLIQAIGFLGYIAVDRMTPGEPCASGFHSFGQPLGNRLIMYGAVGIENVSQGMATGAFGVLLLRITQKQFSATQYALFSSIFALGRTLAGPPAGFLVDAVGWTVFYLLCTAASIPGLWLLSRFVPFWAREPTSEEEAPFDRRPVTRVRLALTITIAGLIGLTAAVLVSALLAALKAARAQPGSPLDMPGALARVLAPSTPSDWILLAALGVVGILAAGAAGAFLAARHGIESHGVSRS